MRQKAYICIWPFNHIQKTPEVTASNMSSSQLQPVQVHTVAGGQRLLKFLCDNTASVGACLRFVLFSLLLVEEVL